jgi:tetratricopeptide (TPR) repeat protein
VRLFERNHLPGDTQVAFRTEIFREAGGYDPSVCGPESFDVLLRALRTGARLACGDQTGYRMFAYPGSLSRDLARQRAALARVLEKHAYDDVRRLYRSAGHSDRIAAWALVIIAQFRGDTGAALEYLDVAAPEGGDPHEILEPEGPWPFPEGWRRAFHRGTILLMQGGLDRDAAEHLHRADAVQETAECANNLGVALARLGQRDRARALFETAALRCPGYVDAVVNAAATVPAALTTHPLRRSASRSEYAVARS